VRLLYPLAVNSLSIEAFSARPGLGISVRKNSMHIDMSNISECIGGIILLFLNKDIMKCPQQKKTSAM